MHSTHRHARGAAPHRGGADISVGDDVMTKPPVSFARAARGAVRPHHSATLVKSVDLRPREKALISSPRLQSPDIHERGSKQKTFRAEAVFRISTHPTGDVRFKASNLCPGDSAFR